jgi:inorganic pyrophosphatase/exopolyphosphatase
MKPILVTSYVNPDLDGVSGAIAYAEFFQKTGTPAVAAVIGELHEEAAYLFNRFSFERPQRVANSHDVDRVVLVDTSDLKNLEGTIEPEKVIEIIDHRAVHEAGSFPNAKVQIELVGAAATLVTERFMQGHVDISPSSAILLCGGIISNTLNFRATMTTDRDHRAYAWLNNIANLPNDFWRELFMAKSDLSGEKLAERIKGDFSQFVFGGKKLGIAQIEMIGAESLIHERGQEIAVILKSIKEQLRLDLIFLNTIELEACKNVFIATDPDMQQLLEQVLKVSFKGGVAQRPTFLMRKQIAPLLREALEYKKES